MASTRSQQAWLFMQRCRQLQSGPQVSVRRQSSLLSTPYDPSRYAHRPPPPTTSHAPSYAHPRAQPPTTTQYVDPRLKLSFFARLKSRFGYPPAVVTTYVPAPFTVKNNPYRARKKWPPNLKTLPEKQQFHFEKTYRRRAKMAFTRPERDRKIRFFINATMLGTLVYFVLFARFYDMGEPVPIPYIDDFRDWFFEKLKSPFRRPGSNLEADA